MLKQNERIYCMKIRWVALMMIFAAIFSAPGCGKKGSGTEGAQGNQQAVSGQAAGVEGQTSVPQEPEFAPITEEKILCGFEKGDDGFEIPGWAEEKADNASKSLSLSKSFASEGTQSLCLYAEFPGKIWTGAVVELEQYLDLTPWRQISCDLYVPKEAPLGLKAKIILTVGEDWTWTEMIGSVPLVPGEWVTVKASIEPGTLMWKRTEVTDEFRKDIRKIDLRIESNKKPEYSGPIYIDNIKVGR